MKFNEKRVDEPNISRVSDDEILYQKAKECMEICEHVVEDGYDLYVGGYLKKRRFDVSISVNKGFYTMQLGDMLLGKNIQYWEGNSPDEMNEDFADLYKMVEQLSKEPLPPVKESKLKEGGNLTVNGKTGEHSATKLRIKDMNLDQYSSFKRDFISFLYGINERFENEYGYPVWEKPELLQTGRMFSGSTRTLFTKEFEEYSARKPKIGDFDVQVPESCFNDFHKFILEEMVDQPVGDWVIYGCSKSPGQDHSLVQADKNYPNVDAEYIQVDWEYTPFTNGEPTEFATFAHYSSWEDLGHNIKGAFRQKLVRALTSTIDERENVVIVSEKTGKPRGQFTKGGIVHFMGYSVDKGVRTKFKPYLDENGNQVMIDGKEAWYEAPTKDSYYEQDMGAIFQLIFGYEPTEQDKKDLFSFVRTVNHLMKGLDEERVKKVFKLFIADIWGPAGQKLSAFDPNEDKEWKTTVYNEFVKAYPYLKEYLPEIKEMQDTYYKNYKTMEKK